MTRRSSCHTLVLAAALVALSSGCSTQREPRLDILYTPSASYHGPDRNPIVVIPGVMGTSLVEARTGVMVWGAFDGHGIDPADAGGARLLALPFDDRPPHADDTDNMAGDPAYGDGVEPAAVLEHISLRLLGIPLQLEVYARILATLGAAGFRDESLGTSGEVSYGDDHFTCFQFAYDWRRDNAENAARLHRFLLEKRAYVAAEYSRRYGIDKPDIKFDIVAHSMGGLLTRYFLRYGAQELPDDGSLPVLNWAGAELVERAVLIATPNAGSLDALQALVEGRRIAPTLPRYPAAIIGTFPSSYQLLPRARHNALVTDGDPAVALDPFDPAIWQRFGWGLAGQQQADMLRMLMPDERDSKLRRSRALLAQKRALERARTFTAALDVDVTTPPGLDVLLVAGDAIDTPSQMSVDDRGKLRTSAYGPGDGTVLRSSVLLDERTGGTWRPTLHSPIDYGGIILLPESHLGITKNGAFRDNMLFWLLEDPRTR